MRVGIDPSLSATAVAVFDGRRWIVRTFSSDKCGDSVRDRVARYSRLASAVTFFLRGLAGAYRGPVAIEGYSLGSHGRSLSHQTGEYGGELRRQLVADGWEPIECPPKTLKKFAADNGNADKPAMILSSRKWLDREMTSDEADAVCLAAWASSSNLSEFRNRKRPRKGKR